MANSLIEPVDGIDEMRTMLQQWRKKGVYTVANTSTLPGCEEGTIDFFKTYLPDAIDGILLPRNYDGTLAFTKGHAIANVIGLLRPSESADIVAVHIDDSPHHNIAVREQIGRLGNARVVTFQPEYTSHLPIDEGSIATRTPLDAFRAADRFLSGAIAA